MTKDRKITILNSWLFGIVLVASFLLVYSYMNGEFPMWNPYMFCGEPTVASGGYDFCAFNYFFFVPMGWIMGTLTLVIVLTREILILHYEEVIEQNKYLRKRLKNKNKRDK